VLRILPLDGVVFVLRPYSWRDLVTIFRHGVLESRRCKSRIIALQCHLNSAPDHLNWVQVWMGYWGYQHKKGRQLLHQEFWSRLVFVCDRLHLCPCPGLLPAALPVLRHHIVRLDLSRQLSLAQLGPCPGRLGSQDEVVGDPVDDQDATRDLREDRLL